MIVWRSGNCLCVCVCVWCAEVKSQVCRRIVKSFLATAMATSIHLTSKLCLYFSSSTVQRFIFIVFGVVHRVLIFQHTVQLRHELAAFFFMSSNIYWSQWKTISHDRPFGCRWIDSFCLLCFVIPPYSFAASASIPYLTHKKNKATRLLSISAITSSFLLFTLLLDSFTFQRYFLVQKKKTKQKIKCVDSECQRGDNGLL